LGRAICSWLEWEKANLTDKGAAPFVRVFTLIRTHSYIGLAFLDGNKRTAYAIMVRFLNHNGFNITAPQSEIVIMCLAVGNDGWKAKQIVEWLEQCCLTALED